MIINNMPIGYLLLRKRQPISVRKAAFCIAICRLLHCLRVAGKIKRGPVRIHARGRANQVRLLFKTFTRLRTSAYGSPMCRLHRKLSG